MKSIKFIKLLAIILILSLSFNLFATFFIQKQLPVFASTSSKNVNYLKEITQTYNVNDTVDKTSIDIQMKISFNYQNKFISNLNEVYRISLLNPKTPEIELENQKKSLKITNSQGNNLSFTTEKSDRSYKININTNSAVYSGQSYIINIHFESAEIAYKIGQVSYISLGGGYSKDSQFDYTDSNGIYHKTTEKRILKAPLNVFNNENLIHIWPQPVKLYNSGNKVIFEYSLDQFISKEINLSAGTEQIYRFEYSSQASATQKEQDLKTKLFKNVYKLSVPSDFEDIGQTVTFDFLSPIPDKIENVEVGGIKTSYFVYYLDSSENKTIYISGFIKINRPKKQSIDQLKSQNLSDISQDVINNFTISEKYWESSDTQIKQIASQLNKNNTNNLYNIIQNTYTYVVDNLDYNQSKLDSLETNVRLGAEQTLQLKQGVCMEYSDLLVALLRAQGIPTISANGAGYEQYDSPQNFIGHQWVLVYFPKTGWVPIDPTWGEQGGPKIGLDLNHVLFELMPRSESNNSLLISYLGGGIKLSTPKIFVHPVLEIPKYALKDKPENTFELLNYSDVLSIAKQDKTTSKTASQVFANYPFISVDQVSQLSAKKEDNSSNFVQKVISENLPQYQNNPLFRSVFIYGPFVLLFLICLLVILLLRGVS